MKDRRRHDAGPRRRAARAVPCRESARDAHQEGTRPRDALPRTDAQNPPAADAAATTNSTASANVASNQPMPTSGPSTASTAPAIPTPARQVREDLPGVRDQTVGDHRVLTGCVRRQQITQTPHPAGFRGPLLLGEASTADPTPAAGSGAGMSLLGMPGIAAQATPTRRRIRRPSGYRCSAAAATVAALLWTGRACSPPCYRALGAPPAPGEEPPTFPNRGRRSVSAAPGFAPCPAPDPLPRTPYPRRHRVPALAAVRWAGECWPGGQLPPGWYDNDSPRRPVGVGP